VRPFHASLFGSAARGDGSTESDIDLFIVRPRAADKEEKVWQRQLDELATKVRQWTGNQLGISEVGESEIASLRKRKPKVIEELRKDAIALHGGQVTALWGRAK
jgi:predicted nucleotidyltransferase